ncbi:MAG: hypothetical protein WAR57_10505 [Candidatus Phosphoribacter sp.]|nr:hypothetical protein [Actinomycetales bacterium]
MTRRLIAFAAGAVVGTAAVYAARALAGRYHGEDGLPDVAFAALAEVSDFLSEVRAGMAERENQLRLALGLDSPPPGARLDPQATRDLLEDPARWRAPRN